MGCQNLLTLTNAHNSAICAHPRVAECRPQRISGEADVNPYTTWNDYRKTVGKATESLKAEQISVFADLMKKAYEEGRKVFLIGNGGSASAASHFCNDLNIGTLSSKNSVKKRMRAISLTDNVSVMTAWANDTDYALIFEQQLRNLADPGDILVAISGSGNSQNIIKAVEYANRAGIETVGFSGFDGGMLKEISNLNVHIDLHNMEMVESIHAMIFHYLSLKLRDELKID